MGIVEWGATGGKSRTGSGNINSRHGAAVGSNLAPGTGALCGWCGTFLMKLMPTFPKVLQCPTCLTIIREPKGLNTFNGTFGCGSCGELLRFQYKELLPMRPTTICTDPGVPWNSGALEQKYQSLLLVEDLVASGISAGQSILSVSIPIAQLPTIPVQDFAISFATTEKVSLDTIIPTEIVYGPIDIAPADLSADHWPEFILHPEIVWDGKSNVVVEVSSRSSEIRFGGGTMVKQVPGLRSIMLSRPSTHPDAFNGCHVQRRSEVLWMRLRTVQTHAGQTYIPAPHDGGAGKAISSVGGNIPEQLLEDLHWFPTVTRTAEELMAMLQPLCDERLHIPIEEPLLTPENLAAAIEVADAKALAEKAINEGGTKIMPDDSSDIAAAAVSAAQHRHLSAHFKARESTAHANSSDGIGPSNFTATGATAEAAVNEVESTSALMLADTRPINSLHSILMAQESTVMSEEDFHTCLGEALSKGVISRSEPKEPLDLDEYQRDPSQMDVCHGVYNVAVPEGTAVGDTWEVQMPMKGSVTVGPRLKDQNIGDMVAIDMGPPPPKDPLPPLSLLQRMNLTPTERAVDLIEEVRTHYYTIENVTERLRKTINVSDSNSGPSDSRQRTWLHTSLQVRDLLQHVIWSYERAFRSETNKQSQGSTWDDEVDEHQEDDLFGTVEQAARVAEEAEQAEMDALLGIEGGEDTELTLAKDLTVMLQDHSNNSWIRRFLTKEVVARCERIITGDSHFCLDDIIQAALENTDESRGFYIGDMECLSVFKPLLEPCLLDLHSSTGLTRDILQSNMYSDRSMAWRSDGLSATLTQVEKATTRIQKVTVNVFRNVEGFSLNTAIKNSDREVLEKHIIDTVDEQMAYLGDASHPITYYSLQNEAVWPDEALDFVWEQGGPVHRSAGFNRGFPSGRGVVPGVKVKGADGETRQTVLLVGQEEHVKISAVVMNTVRPAEPVHMVRPLLAAFDDAKLALEMMSSTLRFQCDPQYGWVTADITRLGVAMEAIVDIEARELSLQQDSDIGELAKLGLLDGSRGIIARANRRNRLVRLTTVRTLGVREHEVVSDLINAVTDVLRKESEMAQHRKQVMKTGLTKSFEMIVRALRFKGMLLLKKRTLQNARLTLSPEEKKKRKTKAFMTAMLDPVNPMIAWRTFKIFCAVQNEVEDEWEKKELDERRNVMLISAFSSHCLSYVALQQGFNLFAALSEQAYMQAQEEAHIAAGEEAARSAKLAVVMKRWRNQDQNKAFERWCEWLEDRQSGETKGRLHSISLPDGQKLGVDFKGMPAGLLVNKVDPSSPLAQPLGPDVPPLESGDIVLTINSMNVRRLNNQQVAGVLATIPSSSGNKKLTFEVDPARLPSQPEAGRKVVVSLPNGLRLGFTCDYLQDGLHVTKVEPGSPVAAAGIRVGDVVIDVAGRSALGIDQGKFSKIVQELESVGGTKMVRMTLTDNFTEAADSIVPFEDHKPKKTPDVGKLAKENPVTVKVHIPRGARLGVVCDFTPSGLLVTSLVPESPMDKSGIPVGATIVGVDSQPTLAISMKDFQSIMANVPEGPDGKVVTMDVIGAPALASGDTDTNSPLLITLPKGAKLGMVCDFLDSGLKVSSITDGSVVQLAGLRVGDVIVSVNGTSTKAIQMQNFTTLLGNTPQDNTGAKQLSFQLSA